MSYRIAIASSSGESVDQHFGQAVDFLIYEVGDTDVDFIEVREVNHFPGESAHSDKNMERLVNLLHDCSAIFVLKIGVRSLRYLHERGIKAFEVNFPLNQIFTSLLKNQQRGRVRVL